jgi:hypothetical protein
MKKLIIGLSLLAVIGSAIATPSTTVEMCDLNLYGPGYFYDPHNDKVCINASSGRTQTASNFGVITGQTELALRVSKLEAQLRMIEEIYGLNLSE